MRLKQRFLLIVSFVFAFALFPNAAYAESHNSLSGVAETIERLFGFIPNIITLEKLMGEDAAAMFWARFLLWVLLFAVFYYGGSFAFKVGEKVNTRIAGTIAFVFASISALLIPDKIIVGIFQSYGLLSAIIIWFVPVIAGLFLVSNIKPKPVKAVIYLGMIFVLVAIDNSITSNFASGLADTIWYAFFKLLLAVVIIAFLWNLLFAGIEGWNADVHGGGHGWDGNGHEGREHDEHPTGDTGGRRGGFRLPKWGDITEGANAELEDVFRGGRGHGPVRPSIPPPTPPRWKRDDPPTPEGVVPPGLYPNAAGPKPTAPRLPKGPKIPDEKPIWIDLSKHFAPIRSQDSLGACTAFAATSIFEYVLHARYAIPLRYLSPLFLWYKTREFIGTVDHNTGPRTCIIPMLNLVQDGVCFEELWKFESAASLKWKRPPDLKAVTDASGKKLIDFRSLDKDDPDQWVHALLKEYPINIGVRFPADMFKPYRKKIYDNFGARTNAGGHAMVIVGYYSHYLHNGKGIKAFKIRNSHGIDWGENGYTWVPAEVLKSMLFEDPIIVYGWKKDDYKHKKEDAESQREIEQLRASIEQEVKRLAIGKESFIRLNQYLSGENYEKAHEIHKDIEKSINIKSLQNLKALLERGLPYLNKILDKNSQMDNIEKELKLYIIKLGIGLYGKTGKTGLYNKLANITKNDLGAIHEKILECVKCIGHIEMCLNTILSKYWESKNVEHSIH